MVPTRNDYEIPGYRNAFTGLHNKMEQLNTLELDNHLSNLLGLHQKRLFNSDHRFSRSCLLAQVQKRVLALALILWQQHFAIQKVF